MSGFSLLIGNKNASSWSLRPWLLLTMAGVDFQEVEVKIRQPDTKQNILAFTPAGKVPALKHDDLLVWDSLAICEYLAELFPEQKFWPEDMKRRAHARALSAEMHAGFQTLRQKMPMVCLSLFDTPEMTPELSTDIERVKAIWAERLADADQEGPFLFGHFTVVDAMYAPVVSRFRTWGVQLEGSLADYAENIFELPAMKKWLSGCNPTDILL